jgi:hypothetical protein
MIVALSVLLAAQTVQTLPPPTADVQSPTDFSCDFLGVEGNRFTLSGIFPEVPAGWDVNRGIAMEMRGDGPTGTTGKMEARPFASSKEFRRFYIPASIPGGEHFNIMIVLFAEETGIATIDRFAPENGDSESKMTSFATEDCKAQFAAVKMKSAPK